MQTGYFLLSNSFQLENKHINFFALFEFIVMNFIGLKNSISSVYLKLYKNEEQFLLFYILYDRKRKSIFKNKFLQFVETLALFVTCSAWFP